MGHASEVLSASAGASLPRHGKRLQEHFPGRIRARQTPGLPPVGALAPLRDFPRAGAAPLPEVAAIGLEAVSAPTRHARINGTYNLLSGSPGCAAYLFIASGGGTGNNIRSMKGLTIGCGIVVLFAISARAEWEELYCHQHANALVPTDISASGRKYAPSRQIDILHVAIDVTPDFKQRSINGEVTLRFKPIAQPFSE